MWRRDSLVCKIHFAECTVPNYLMLISPFDHLLPLEPPLSALGCVVLCEGAGGVKGRVKQLSWVVLSVSLCLSLSLSPCLSCFCSSHCSETDDGGQMVNQTCTSLATDFKFRAAGYVQPEVCGCTAKRSRCGEFSVRRCLI